MEDDIIISVGDSDKYSSKLFKCQTLRFEGKATFSGCSFPNLHFIEFNCSSDEPYLPFEDCQFDHPMNLHFEQKIHCILPFNLVIQSMISTEESTILAENHEWTGPLNYVMQHDISVKAKYGDDPEEALEQYRDLFSLDSVKFSTEAPKSLMEPVTLTVVGEHLKVLGEIKFEIKDDPFSKAILLTEGVILEYSGSVPLNWGDKIHPLVKEKISQLRELKIDGDLHIGAFTGLNLFLRVLSVSGMIYPEAFDRTYGKIAEFNVTELSNDSLLGSELQLVRVRVDRLGEKAGLKAEIVSLLDASDLPGIKHAKTLIIRKRFTEPIDLSGSGITKIDFTEVESKGPYILLNFNDQEKIVLLDRQVLYKSIRKVLKGKSGDEIYSQITRELEVEYSQDHCILYSNGQEVIIPDDIEDGEVVVKINNKRVGHFLVSYENFGELVAWGVAAVLTFFMSHLLVGKF